MAAYHSNQYMLMMPRMVYLFYFLKRYIEFLHSSRVAFFSHGLLLASFIPIEALLVAGNFFQVNSTMDTFTGRQKKD